MFRIPMLLSHYIEHQEDDHMISFSEFLYQHYETDDGNDQDNARDEQLPFKSQDNGISTSNNHFIHYPNSDFLNLTSYDIKSRLSINYQEPFIPTARLNRIWQPPKMA